MPGLTGLLGGPRIWIKRDDCTGLATGGNKNRKLEFLVGEALAARADTLVTLGALQSNHVRQTAAAAAKFGLRCVGLLRQSIPTNDPDYPDCGNVLLDRLAGLSIEYLPAEADMRAALEQTGERLRGEGARPYLIPAGGSTPTGALGYVAAALELLMQANEAGLGIDRVVHASGSAGTQAGLVAGFEAMHAAIRVLGISVGKPRDALEADVHELAEETAAKLGLKGGVRRDAVEVNADYVGNGYGIPTEGMAEAVMLLARHEGILLDPVYTGKAMAGLIDLIRRGAFGKDENVVFIHTGGQAGLFAYKDFLTQAAAAGEARRRR
jgi:L-cysteate sulfo-lyase